MVRWRQQRARPVQGQHRLLLGALHRHKAHARALHGLADRLGVAAVGLVALDVRLDVGGRQQPHLMAKPLQPPRPVMRAAARLDPDHRRRQRGEEPLELAPAQPLAQHRAAGGVDTVNLEDVLRQIQTDHAKLHRGRLPLLVFSKQPVWPTRCRTGAVHPIIARSDDEAIQRSSAPFRTASLRSQTQRGRGLRSQTQRGRGKNACAATPASYTGE
jgi:hypothetical protein